MKKVLAVIGIVAVLAGTFVLFDAPNAEAGRTCSPVPTWTVDDQGHKIKTAVQACSAPSCAIADHVAGGSKGNGIDPDLD